MLKWWLNRKISKTRRKLISSRLPKRLELARNSQTDIEVLKSLATDRSHQVRQTVAENFSATEEIIEILTKDKNSIVRSSVARRNKLTDFVIDTLIQDTNETVLVALSVREKLKPNQQEMLSKSGPGVRQKLAIRKDLSKDVALKLSQDVDFRVRVILAAVTTYPEVLDILELDQDLEVVKILEKRKGTYDPKHPKWQISNQRLQNDNDRWLRLLRPYIAAPRNEDTK